jgi:hypothetical protein
MALHLLSLPINPVDLLRLGVAVTPPDSFPKGREALANWGSFKQAMVKVGMDWSMAGMSTTLPA